MKTFKDIKGFTEHIEMIELSVANSHLNNPPKIHCKNNNEMFKKWVAIKVKNYLYKHSTDIVWNQQLIEEMQEQTK